MQNSLVKTQSVLALDFGLYYSTEINEQLCTQI